MVWPLRSCLWHPLGVLLGCAGRFRLLPLRPRWIPSCWAFPRQLRLLWPPSRVPARLVVCWRGRLPCRLCPLAPASSPVFLLWLAFLPALLKLALLVFFRPHLSLLFARSSLVPLRGWCPTLPRLLRCRLPVSGPCHLVPVLRRACRPLGGDPWGVRRIVLDSFHYLPATRLLSCMMIHRCLVCPIVRRFQCFPCWLRIPSIL